MPFVPHQFKNTIEVQSYRRPRILLSEEVVLDQSIMTDLVETEIGCLGAIDEVTPRSATNDGVFLVRKLYLLRQGVHSTTTEISVEGMTELATELITAGNDAEVGKINYWYHSHVNMGVEPSGQDEDQVKLFRDSGNPYMLRAIGNKRGQLRIDFFDFQAGVVVRDIEWSIQGRDDQTRRDFWKKEIAEKVKAITYSSGASGYGRYPKGPDRHYTGFWNGDDEEARWGAWSGDVANGDVEINGVCEECGRPTRFPRKNLFQIMTCPYKKDGCGKEARMVTESFYKSPPIGSALSKTLSTTDSPASVELVTEDPLEGGARDHEQYFCGRPRGSAPSERVVNTSKTFEEHQTYPRISGLCETPSGSGKEEKGQEAPQGTQPSGAPGSSPLSEPPAT